MVTGLLLRDGRVLLCHRSPDRRWYPDVWDLPGGHVESGEEPEQALARELREELDIELIDPPGPVVHTVREPDLTLQVFLVERWTGSLRNRAPEEHDAMRWVGLADLADLDLAHPAYAALLGCILRRNL